MTNDGQQAQEHMILYHMNLGWPMLAAGAVLSVPARATHARDEVARAGMTSWHRFGPPEREFAEQVFRHELAPDEPVEVRLDNPRLGAALTIAFHSGQLPHLFQWKMLRCGTYVLGIEPANCATIDGRAQARAGGILPTLEPGESRRYEIAIGID